MKGWGISFHEWKNFADVYREWKQGKEAMESVRSSIEPNERVLVIKADATIAEMRWGYMRRWERVDGKGLKAPAPTVVTIQEARIFCPPFFCQHSGM